jgi:hypothetical protein
MFKYLLCFLSLLCLSKELLFAQTTENNPSTASNSISITGFNGINIFSAEKNYLKGENWGTEIGYNLNLKNNESDWVRMMNAKSISFVFSYRNMDDVYLTKTAGTTGFLGNAYTVVSLLDLSLFQAGKVNFLLTPGFGVTYATKTYRTNYNPVIGSHINLGAEIGLKAEAPVSSSMKIQLGLHLFHYSNAAFNLSNNGVNTINASIGIIRDIDAYKNPRKIVAFNIEHKSSFEFGLGIGHRGLKQNYNQKLSPADSIKLEYATSHLNNVGIYAGYNYRLNPLLSLKGGTDVVYYSTTFNKVNFLYTSQDYGTSYDKFSVGTSIGADLWLSKVVFEADYGYYLHLKYDVTPVHTYWNFGVKYYLTNWVALETKAYLHRTQAHFANFGLLFHI